jgi:hypothetical protein
MDRFIKILIISLVLSGIGTVHASGTYILTATDGQNVVAGVMLTDTGTTFTIGRPFLFISSAKIGTTSPQIVTVNGVQKVWIHHTFLSSANLPVYGIAKFDLTTGQLEALIPVPGFLISRLDILNIFADSDRSLTSKKNTNDVFSALLNPSSGIPGARKSVFNNVPPSDVVFGATISRDGKLSVQSVQHTEGSNITRVIQAKKVLNGGGSGSPSGISSNVVGYSPAITDALGTSAPGGTPSHTSSTFRLLAYRVFRNFGTANQQSQILIQQVNDVTGFPIGAARALTNFVKAPQFGLESSHSIAFAQDGTFILYTTFNSGCQKNILIAQRLNASGNKAGPSQVLAGCNQLASNPLGLYGMDIVKLP